jgi:hypothetical protein
MTTLCQRDTFLRERHRLIKKGFIRPAYAMQPQLMVKDEGGNWVPEIKVISETVQ